MTMSTIIFSYLLFLTVRLIIEITKPVSISAEAARFVGTGRFSPRQPEIKVRDLANTLPPEMLETTAWEAPPITPPHLGYRDPRMSLRIELMIKRVVEAGQRINIVIDDPLLLGLTLSSDIATVQACGAPTPVKHAGSEAPSCLNFTALPSIYGDPKEPHFHSIKLRVCPAGQILFLGEGFGVPSLPYVLQPDHDLVEWMV
jgi:hypothetical protein